jgi:antitoxin component of MazEF toxin-antitoxin module
VKLKIRRVGNSLGVLLPRDALLGWGLGEGDTLQLGLGGIRPVLPRPRRRETLDELSRAISLAVIRHFSSREIRAQMRASMQLRRQQHDWDELCDEWAALARGKDDGALFAAMLGRDERSVSRRQYLPYTDLLSAAQLRSLREGAVG